MSSMQTYALTVDKFLDHAAKWHGAAEVVTASGAGRVRIGYADLRRRAARLSAALSDLGIGRGDMIATLGWNTQGHVETWYAAAGIGAVCHTLNPRLTVEQLTTMAGQSCPRALLFGEGLDSLARKILPACAEGAHGIALDRAEDAACRSVANLIDSTDTEAAWGIAAEEDPAGLCFTSGTTGAPKGVLYTHRSNYLHTLRLLQADALGLSADDRILAVVPMFHANGWGLPFAAPAVGAGLILPGRQLDGASLARLIVEEGVTVAAGVPTVWLDLLDHVSSAGLALPTLRHVFLGGAPLPVEVQRRLETGLGVAIHTSWGMTELSPLGTISTKGVEETLPGSSGRVPIGVDLRLVDENGTPLPDQHGASGRLEVRGASVVRRYWNEPDDAVDADNWFDTGDLARIAPDGSVTITGRAKDLIKSGGEWINPAEIERIVGGVPGVALAAVIGRPDPRWGERPVLVIEPQAGTDVPDTDLTGALTGRIASWWMPDAIIRVDRMPLAATGKIDKMTLRRSWGNPEGLAP